MPELTSINISLPERLKLFVEQEVERGGYSSNSEYLRELIRAAARQRASNWAAETKAPQPDPASREDAFWSAVRQRSRVPRLPRIDTDPV